MKRRWWVVGVIVLVGAGSTYFSDDVTDTSEHSANSSTVVETETESATDPAAPPTEDPPSAVESDPDGPQTSQVLETLEVKGRAPKTGYDRDQFGQRWADIDRNGCDTRNDILNRDLTDKTYEPGTRDCVVLTGTMISPYTSDLISFQRGESTSSEVQIDHVVALSDAWQKGAQQLSPGDRELFANDPLNLLAVDGRSNAQKGAGDAATWLPSQRSYRCTYVSRQVGVKAKYELWVTAAERDAILGVLSSCPDHTIPEPDEAGPLPPSGDTRQNSAPGEPAPAPTSVPAPDEDVYYANCTEARDAGVTPLYEGDPGYRAGMDGDSDGIACE